ncbi:MAG: hypothetical protein L6Q72_06870 [Burkholderiaceae bacterium]|nr:hypothetical protein [Burkholderiaceae bacterium]GIL06561.1 MAG: hypothetical protein BroJett031_30810 [Betaproteobacteria bacterium]
MNTERVSVGATEPPGGGGEGGAGGGGVGAGAGGCVEFVESLPPEQPAAAIAAATLNEHENSNARRFMTAPPRRLREQPV